MNIINGNTSIGQNRLDADISGLPSGLYFVKVTAGGESCVEKVMKE